MNLHIVGGFLGSGKTTAIIGAAKRLMGEGKRVGVVTNDQGKYLVDTAFSRLSDVPTVEVSGGCFCCNFSDFEASLEQLNDAARPDVVFAESVGSCADVVATVIKPLLTATDEGRRPESFSVFTDIRLIGRRLRGDAMPFSENVIYIYDEQLEEAGLIVLNKRDLVDDEEAAETLALIKARFPETPVLLQCSLDGGELSRWIGMLASGQAPAPAQSLDIDYERYGDGEAQLAWLDEEIVIAAGPSGARVAVVALIRAIASEMRRRETPVGHLKFLASDDTQQAKISFTTVEGSAWEADVPEFAGDEVKVIVNARAEMDAEALRDLVSEAARLASGETGAIYREQSVAFFHPGFPNPERLVD